MMLSIQSPIIGFFKFMFNKGGKSYITNFYDNWRLPDFM